MATRFLNRMRALAANEDGFALFIVIGITSVLTILAIGGMYLAQQASHEAVTMKNESEAFQAANAGIDAAVARLTSHGFQDADYPVILSTAELGSGSAVATMTAVDGYEYRCVSTGTALDGTVETVTVQLFYLNIYDMNISSQGNPTSGAALKGNSSIYGPFYAIGTMDLSSNTSMEKGPLFIKNGNITLGGSGSVGSSTLPIIVYCDGTVPNTGSKNWYVSKLNRTVPLITLPLVDAAYLNTMYGIAREESADNEMGAGTSPNKETRNSGFDSDPDNTNDPEYTYWNGVAGGRTRITASGTNTSRRYKYIGPYPRTSAVGAGATNVTIDGSTPAFGKFNYNPANTTQAGVAFDDWAFNPSTSPATLYVNGTVFIDGDLTITIPIQYIGNGAIVCNGDISVNNFAPVGGMSADASGTPNQNFPADKIVGLVSPTRISLHGGGGNSNKDYTTPPDTAAALFCSQTISLDNNLCFAGSIIAATIEGPTSGTNPHIRPAPNLKDVLSESMPGRNTFLSTIAAWSRR